MIGNFKEVTEVVKDRFAESPLGKLLENVEITDLNEDIDLSLDRFADITFDENCDDNGNQYRTSDGKLIPDNTYNLDGVTYKTDDNGNIYSVDGRLQPNTTYELNENVYTTDDHGRIIFCDSKPTHTEDGPRNIKEQRESGGEDRQENDDGGHIIARELGGSEGKENLVPMRREINRGDYKKMELEIDKALKDGKDVRVRINVEYEGNSQRPSNFRAEYTIDGNKTDIEFDNEENSTELLDFFKDKISNEDYNNLANEIEDMKADGKDVSITSVKVENDENGNSVKVTVCMIDESTGEKTYKPYEPKRED